MATHHKCPKILKAFRVGLILMKSNTSHTGYHENYDENDNQIKPQHRHGHRETCLQMLLEVCLVAATASNLVSLAASLI